MTLFIPSKSIIICFSKYAKIKKNHLGMILVNRVVQNSEGWKLNLPATNGTSKKKTLGVKISLKHGCLSLTGIKQFIRVKNIKVPAKWWLPLITLIKINQYSSYGSKTFQKWWQFSMETKCNMIKDFTFKPCPFSSHAYKLEKPFIRKFYNFCHALISLAPFFSSLKTTSKRKS